MDCAPVDEEIVKLGAAVPAPLSATVCGEPPASSATLSVAVKLAADAGENVMEMVQLAPAARLVPQVLVSAKSVGLVPTMPMLLMVSIALPVLVKAAVCAALVAPLTAVKLSDAGVSEAAAAGAAVPVPESEVDCVDGVASSVTVSVAAYDCAAAGVKVT